FGTIPHVERHTRPNVKECMLMRQTLARRSAFVVMVWCLAPLMATAADRPPTAEQIAQWVQDLGHERFAVRQQATANLVKAGAPAVEALGRAAASPSPEVVTRVFGALREMLTSPDGRTRAEAERVLKSLAASGNRRVMAG